MWLCSAEGEACGFAAQKEILNKVGKNLDLQLLQPAAIMDLLQAVQLLLQPAEEAGPLLVSWREFLEMLLTYTQVELTDIANTEHAKSKDCQAALEYAHPTCTSTSQINMCTSDVTDVYKNKHGIQPQLCSFVSR